MYFRRIVHVLQTIGRKVIHTVGRLGVDYAQELLHSYNCLIDEPAGAVILRRDTVLPPTRSMVSQKKPLLLLIL